MSADTLGARLLAEAKHESLTSLLADVRLILQPRSRTRFGLGQIDNIVDHIGQAHIQRQNESAASVGPSSDVDDEDEDIDLFATNQTARHKIPPRPKPVIVNLQSQTPSSSYATQSLLYELVARAILPKSNEGQQAAVVWLDTRNCFSATRLFTIITSSLQRSNGKGTAPDQHDTSTIASQAKDALSHVHTIAISSPAQLLHSFVSLHQYLSDSSAHRSSSRPLSLIVLDSATQFHWQHRFEAEVARLNALPISSDQADTSPSHQPHAQPVPLSTQITTQLKALAVRYECAVLYTTSTHDFYSTTKSNSGASDIWSNTAWLTLCAKRADVTQFAPQMSLQECLRDRQKRQEAVDAGTARFTATSGGKLVDGFDACIHAHGLQF